MSTTLTQSMSEIFNALASQLGIDTESKDIKDILSDKRLTEVQIPNDLAAKFTSGFLTVGAAKNHPEINKHFKVKHLAGVDNRLNQELKTIGIPQDILDEVSGIPDTLERIKFVVPKLQEHYKATFEKTGAGKGDEKYIKLLGEYDAKVKEIQKLTESFDSEKGKWGTERENLEIGFEVNALLNGYTFGEAYQAEDVRLLIDRKLREKPFVFKRIDGKVGVFNKENLDLKAMKDNKEISVKSLLDEVVAPYLKKSAGTGGGNAGKQDPPLPPVNGNNKKLGEQVSAELQKARDLRAGKHLQE